MKVRNFLLFIFLLNSVAFAQFGFQSDIVKIESYQSFDKVYPGSEFKLALKVNIDSTWHINSNAPYEDFLIPTELVINGEGFALSSTAYPEADDIELGFSDKPLSVWEGEIYIGGLIKTDENLSPGNHQLIVTLNYQACNDKTCLPPNSIADTINVIIAGKQSAINQINEEIFSHLELNYSSSSEILQTKENDPISSALENSGLLLGLVFIFIGGLALNLTPCVYPLIPITIGYFGGQSEGNTGKLTFMGILFVLGMALTYSVIGVITALSGAVFGSLLQNTFVIIFIVLIFIALALSMFGLYEFKLPDSLVAKAGGAKSGYYGAFFMGLTMGIVAAPCIGPFVLGLVAYVAAKANPYEGFLMFFVLAIGLGTPYLLLAVFSGKIKKLPRAGEWMEAVKHIFGFILLGMALYFLLPLLPDSISGFVLPLYMIVTAIYLLFFEKYADKIKGFKIFKLVFSLLILFVGIYSFIPSETEGINWETYSENSLPQNINEKRGIIIDFYADWCIPCKELDAFTFSDPTVVELSKDFHTFKADMTKSLSPEVEKLKEKYNIIGVPTVLIIDSKGKEVKRITGFVDAEEFYKIISQIN